MSWVKAIDEAESSGNDKIVHNTMQAAMNEISGKVQAVTDTIDPGDYPFLLVCFRLAAKAIISVLDPIGLSLADTIEARTSSTIVKVPDSLKRKDR